MRCLLKNTIRLAALSAIAALIVLAVLPMEATPATDPLSTGYWLMPVPADQSTGKVIQSEITGGVAGYIPGDCYGAYPTWQAPNPHFNLASTPILSMDVYVDACWQLYIIVVDQSRGWNPYGWEITQQYGHTEKIHDGSTMRVADSNASTHFTVDLRSANIPLDKIGRIQVNIVPGMKEVPSNYRITNLSVSAAGNASTPTPVPTSSPTPPPSTASPTPTAKPTTSPTPSATPKPTQFPWGWWSWFRHR